MTTLMPNPTAGIERVILTAQADDSTTGGSDVTLTEYFIGNDPGIGRGAKMRAVDGLFDSPSELVRVTIDADFLKPGEYPIGLRAKDSSGNWGETTSYILYVSWLPPPPPIRVIPYGLCGPL